jgi:hypothetical protein
MKNTHSSKNDHSGKRTVDICRPGHLTRELLCKPAQSQARRTEPEPGTRSFA